MSLAEALARVDKMFGRNAVMRLGDACCRDVEVIPTGSLALDAALGVGGYPRGRIVEIYGPESSGKSTLALHAVANAQRLGAVAYLDTEHALDAHYCRALGVDVDALLLSQPDNAEQALEIAQLLVTSGELSALVVDSVAALVPARELEGDFGDANVGVHARLMSQAMRKLTGPLDATKTLAIFVNQLRQKVGVVFGSPEVTTGGVALKYYASMRLDVRRGEVRRVGEQATGHVARIRVVKNKLAPPLRQVEVEIAYGQGIRGDLELVNMGVAAGVITQRGAWLSCERDGQTVPLGQGREKAAAALSADEQLAAWVRSQLGR